jgi:signal transduction histidine kinase
MFPVPAPSRRDLLLGTVLTVTAQIEVLLSADKHDGSLLPHVVTNLLILPGVTLRRVAPLLAVSLAAVGLAVEPLLGPAPVATPYLCLLFLLVCLGWYAGTRTGLVGLGLTLVAGLTYDLTTDDFLLADLVVNVAIIVMAWSAGRGMRIATDRRVRAELAADRAARDAVAEERERIGRELHDSMAHALTLITLSAGSARERTEEALAGDSLDAIERTGREALADLHRFLALIGPGEGEAPGLAHLADLVEGVRRSGLAVDLDLRLVPDELPASLSSTLYRVVQEGLTNVVRHSEARTARIVVSRDGSAVLARVTDDGIPVPARTTGSGRGLAGLRQRVGLFDGTLEAAPNSEGWCLEARIPISGGS